MKKYLFIAGIILTVNSISAQPPVNSPTPIQQLKQNTVRYNNKSDELKKEITRIRVSIVEAIKNKDIATIKKLVSDRFTKASEGNLEKLINDISRIISGHKYEVRDEYYTTIETDSSEPVGTIMTGTYFKNFFINQFRFFSKEVYNITLVSDDKKVSTLLFLSLSKQSSGWKVEIVMVGTYGVNGFSVPDLYTKNKTLLEQNKIFQAAINAMVMKTILRPLPFLQYAGESKFTAQIEEILGGEKLNGLFPAKANGATITGLTVKLFRKEGIVPLVYYLTNHEFESDEFKAETISLKSDLKKIMPDLLEEYKAILIKAIHQRDAKNIGKKNVQINSHNTILEFE